MAASRWEIDVRGNSERGDVGGILTRDMAYYDKKKEGHVRVPEDEGRSTSICSWVYANEEKARRQGLCVCEG